MSSPTIPRLSHHYADAVPMLVQDSQAETQPDPHLLVLNEDLAAELGLDVDWLRSDAGLQFLTGAQLPTDARPVATGYAGHQFGQFVPQLGDGRALLLGELSDTTGRLREIQLKGSGPTAFSRPGSDGRGAIGPMLREHLISEAMHALGVPTTRSLAVITTGNLINRERALPGAMLVRVSSGHVRVGTMQFARLHDPDGSKGVIGQLADHVIERHYPALLDSQTKYLDLFDAVMARQAATVAKWMRLGFVHGVMNTDNTALTGETLDYGPCAFLDRYDRTTFFSSIDQTGRYAFGNQPSILGWNLARLVEAMLPLFDEDEDVALNAAQEKINSFHEVFDAARRADLSRALDIGPGAEDLAEVIRGYDQLLEDFSPDVTAFHRGLVDAAAGDQSALRALIGDHELLDAWLTAWLAHTPDPATLGEIHPVTIPRNHVLAEALSKAEDGDLGDYRDLLAAVTSPFHQRLEFIGPAPEDAAPFITYCGT